MNARPRPGELERWLDWCAWVESCAAGPAAAAAWREALETWRESGGEAARLIRRLCHEGRVYVEIAAGESCPPALPGGKAAPGAGGLAYAAGAALGHTASLGLSAFAAAAESATSNVAGESARPATHASAAEGAETGARFAAALVDYIASLDLGHFPAPDDAGPDARYVGAVRQFERAHGELVGSRAYARVHGELINALVRVLALGPDMVNPALGQTASAPGRTAAAKGGSRARLAGARPEIVAVQSVSRRLASGAATIAGLGEVDTGPTPRRKIAGRRGFELYRYEPTNTRVAGAGTPLLIVYALANKAYITDLEPERSFVRALLDEGLDTYLIEWETPGRTDRTTGLEDYVCDYIDACVENVRAARGTDRVNLLGICQGGVFSLAYGALRPEKTNAIVTMVTPVDFHAPDNLLSAWMRHVDVDAMVDTLGNIPGDLLNWTFDSLRPLRSSGQRFLGLLERLCEPAAAANWMRMERWVADSPEQAGEAFRQFAVDLFQHNRLVQGGFRIGAHEVRLADVTCPVLNLHASNDHIVPGESARRTNRWLGSRDYEEAVLPTGHIGIFTSDRARKAAARRIGEWLRLRSAP